MAILQNNIEYTTGLSVPDALKIAKDPTLIESPNGWGEYRPNASVVIDGRYINVYGSMSHENDLHTANLLIICPNFASKALAKARKKVPIANVHVLIEPIILKG